MTVPVFAPQTESILCADQVDIDLKDSSGPVTFTADGVLGAAEEIVFNTINSDNTCLQVIEDTKIKKLTLSNSLSTTHSPARFRITKTVTVLPVGLKISRSGV